jgi:hypothetical protein
MRFLGTIRKEKNGNSEFKKNSPTATAFIVTYKFKTKAKNELL